MNRVNKFLLLPVVEVQAPAGVFLESNVAELEAASKDLRCAPLAGNHDVEVRLVPKVVAARRLLPLGPCADALEVLVEENEIADRVFFGVAHRRYHDVAVRQAVTCVRCTNIVFTQNIALDDLEEFWLPRVLADIEDETEMRERLARLIRNFKRTYTASEPRHGNTSLSRLLSHDFLSEWQLEQVFQPM